MNLYGKKLSILPFPAESMALAGGVCAPLDILSSSIVIFSPVDVKM